MSVGIFKNGKYNKVAGNAKDSTAANTTYNNGTSGLQANNVQSAIDELDSTVDTLNSNFYYRTAKIIVTSYSLSFDKDNVGLIIYRVSNSIHAVLVLTYFKAYGITVKELFCSNNVSYTTDGNTISFTAGGNILFIGTDWLISWVIAYYK